MEGGGWRVEGGGWRVAGGGGLVHALSEDEVGLAAVLLEVKVVLRVPPPHGHHLIQRHGCGLRFTVGASC